jgi:hypothetical protein
VRDTQTGDAPTSDAAIQQEEETGAAATRTRGELPRWVLPALVIAALVILVLNIGAFDGSTGGWIVLAGIIVVTIGVAIALNPRRSSIPGGTARR